MCAVILQIHVAGQIKPQVNSFLNQVNLFQPGSICFNLSFFFLFFFMTAKKNCTFNFLSLYLTHYLPFHSQHPNLLFFSNVIAYIWWVLNQRPLLCLRIHILMPYLLSRSGLDANLPVGIFLNYIQKYISLNYASNTCVMGPVLSPTGQHGRMC